MCARIMHRLTGFAFNQEGAVSIWNLFWLVGFCGLMGLAVDISAAMNTKARLQNVSDVSAHGGTMDISPTPANAVMTAIEYADNNLSGQANVVTEPDITPGWWDFEANSFATDDPRGFNALQVVATRDASRGNAQIASLLKVVGFNAFDINAVSVAAAVPLSRVLCRSNGLIAGGTMEQTSNNTIVGPFCEYGDTLFKIGQNNLIECGVVLMTPSPANFQNGTPPDPTAGPCNTNYGGLSGEDMIAQAFVYGKIPIVADLEYENAKAVLTKYVNGQPFNDPFRVIPPWVTSVQTLPINTFNNAAKQGNLVPGTLYNVSCAGTNKRLELTGFVQNVGVFTDCEVDVSKDKDVSDVKPTKTETGSKKTNLCDPDNSTCSNVDWDSEITAGYWSCAGAISQGFESYSTHPDTAGSGTYRDGSTDTEAQNCGIEPGANGLWDNVLIFTSYLEGGNIDQKAITFPNNMQLGRIDGCTEGGGVRIYSAGSVETPSGTTAHGIQIVTLGGVQFAAKANGVMGINIQAMGDIKYTANGLMGGCSPEENDRQTEVVLTVRPIAIVQ